MITVEYQCFQGIFAPLAQLDRALVYGTKGWGFDLLKARQKESFLPSFLFRIDLNFVHNTANIVKVFTTKSPGRFIEYNKWEKIINISSKQPLF
jgi:hypothetical protein